MFKKILFLFYALFFLTNIQAQSLSIKGKLVDAKTLQPLESATIYVSAQKDSSVIDYTISDKSGYFVLQTRKNKLGVIVQVSFLGYKTFRQNFDNLSETIDLGIIKLDEQDNALDEVVVVSEAPPVRVKNDTLEFNASSFKIRPDSNVQSLLKQLPGVEVDESGKITVNGKEVNQILVNGKPFFDKDGKVALQNLPSDIIDKIQVSDTKTKSEELSGQNATANEASINLTIQEDKNKGYFGKITGGIGTQDRYESSLMFNYFKGERKVSVLASSNNINATGFSMDEIFDNMGGGRNMYSTGDGGFVMNGMRFGGGGRGITQSHLFGINYADQIKEKVESNASYFFSQSSTENTNRTEQTVFLPDLNYRSESVSKALDEQYSHNVNLNFEWKVDSTFSVYFEPKFVKSNRKSLYDFDQQSNAENGDLLNETSSQSNSESDTNEFQSYLYLNKQLKKKGRMLSFYANNSIDNKQDDDLLVSQNQFYENNALSNEDNRNQLALTQRKNQSFTSGFEYFEPIKDSLSFKVGIRYEHRKASNDRTTNDFDAITNGYDAFNDALSNFLASNIQKMDGQVGLQMNKKKWNASINFGPSFARFVNESFYMGEQTNLNKNYVLPDGNFYLSYRFNKSKSFYTYYRYNVDFPTASQILPVENLANPLNIIEGNPDLDLNRSHYLSFNFRNYDFESKSGYSIYMGGNYFDSNVANFTIFDESRRRFTTFVNIYDTYTMWFGGNWNKTIKKEANTFKVTLSLRGNHQFNKGFTNEQLFTVSSLSMTPKINLNWDYGELFSIAPSYSLTLNSSQYTNYTLESLQNTLHNFNVQVTNYWPKNFIFGNDFGYTYNSNIADGFQKYFYLWNTSLAYQMFNKKLIAKVKVYDMLNQNIGNLRSITATGVRDEQNTVLRRYAMFSLTFKLDQFGDKK